MSGPGMMGYTEWRPFRKGLPATGVAVDRPRCHTRDRPQRRARGLGLVPLLWGGRLCVTPFPSPLPPTPQGCISREGDGGGAMEYGARDMGPRGIPLSRSTAPPYPHPQGCIGREERGARQGCIGKPPPPLQGSLPANAQPLSP